eukprot:6182095-Pleurochrysis_carterae.AAC.2
MRCSGHRIGFRLAGGGLCLLARACAEAFTAAGQFSSESPPPQLPPPPPPPPPPPFPPPAWYACTMERRRMRSSHSACTVLRIASSSPSFLRMISVIRMSADSIPSTAAA